GAFLAGSIVAASAQARRIEEIVRPFNTLFAAFFFFSIGMLVDVHDTLSSLPLLFGLLVVATVGKYAGSTIGAYLSGLSGRSASFSGTALLPLGELSLLIASGAAASGLLPAGVVGLLATVIVLTSLLSVVLVNQEGNVYNHVKDLIPELVTRNLRTVRSTSVGMQRVVEENSRYSRIVSRLPAIGRGPGWTYSSHDSMTLAVKNVVLFGAGALVLFLLLRLGTGPLQAPLASFFTYIFLGFYLIGALFLVNVAAALAAYTQMLAHTGREGLRTVIHFGAVLVFGGLGAAVTMATVMYSDWHFLIFWAPILILGSSHAWALVGQARLAILRMRVRL
ncbi:MAG: cation:proton antiporter, partial [Candidatus Micrarchaeota archaeon]|nr:cation:proton antiporter [Candidatus Micrarchaeota archaeon]